MGTTTYYSQDIADPFSAAYEDLWGYTQNNLHNFTLGELLTRSADYDFADFALFRAIVKDLAETPYNLGSSLSGALTVDYTNGHSQYGTLTGNITSLTISNAPPSSNVGFLSLHLIQDGTGSRTLTLSSSTYKFSQGSAVTLTTTAGARDILRLERYPDDNTKWAVFINQNMS